MLTAGMVTGVLRTLLVETAVWSPWSLAAVRCGPVETGRAEHRPGQVSCMAQLAAEVFGAATAS